MADLEKIITGLECCSVKQSCSECPWMGLDCNDRLHLAALELLKEQKYGHWIRSPKFLSEAQCSVCKETYVGDCRTFNYCPSCGTKMAEVIEWR